MASQLLFVYGTLKSDASNVHARYLHQRARLLGEATWEGSLYLVRNYPGAVRSQIKGELVLGELWELNDPEELLGSLDEYEECSPKSLLPHEYERSIELIHFNGRLIKAWVYIYQLDAASLQKISSGNFVNENKALVRRST